MGIFSWFVNKMKNSRFGMRLSQTKFVYGSIYEGSYANWKHDPEPLIFCMYSDGKFTHGLNIHYMNRNDKQWFGRTIYLIAKGRQRIDGMTLYKMLKMQRPSIIKDCYRMYFTSMCNYKMVCPGVNPELMKGIYKSKDGWVLALNNLLEPGKLYSEDSVQVAYSEDELKDRIMQAQNSVSLSEMKVTSTPSAQGSSPWSTGRPY